MSGPDLGLEERASPVITRLGHAEAGRLPAFFLPPNQLYPQFSAPAIPLSSTHQFPKSTTFETWLNPSPMQR